MKKIFLLFAVALLMIACNKDDEAPQPTPEPSEIEMLPPATQTGANKVGCLLNGKAFCPLGSQLTVETHIVHIITILLF